MMEGHDKPLWRRVSDGGLSEALLRYKGLKRFRGLGVPWGFTFSFESLALQGGDAVKIGKVPKGLLVVPFHSKVNKITNNALNKAGTPEFKFSTARIKKAQKSKAHSG